MKSEPNWLNIQDQLYPQVYIFKVIHIENSSLGLIHYPVELLYNYLHREFNITEALSEIIRIYFQLESEYEVLMLDEEQQKYKNIGRYPFKDPVLLKEWCIQGEMLRIRLEEVVEEKAKAKADKTLKAILQRVAQWRKIHIESKKKVTLEQSANMMGISRNTLDDYYFQIKLAQKYGYNFEKQLEKPFQNLRKFVKQNQQKKQKNKIFYLPHILYKYQPK